MSPYLTGALDLAARGTPVFPCWNTPEDTSTDKAPLTRNGHQDATTDPAKVTVWWTENPDALIAYPTGKASGLNVLDIDTKEGKGGAAWLRANAHLIPPTRVQRTRSGGLHIIFQAQDGLRCSAGTIHDGVDVRADGGYAIAWQHHGCVTTQPRDPVPWSSELLELVTARQTRTRETDRDAASLAPPNWQTVVDLLDTLPNPADVDRDTYLSVMLSARGCIQGLEAAGEECDAEAIGDAAARWAMRWEHYNGTDEHAKWEADFSGRTAPLAGWDTLQRHARRMTPGYADQEAAADFAGVIAAFRTSQEKAASDLADALGWNAWEDLELPPTTKFLGAVIMNSTRLTLVGSTGLGKSQLGLAIAASIASGAGFLHWHCDRPARVLVIDGEMSKRVIQQRLQAARRRHKAPIPKENFTLYALDRSAEMAKRFPDIGRFEPLNTPDGQGFMKRLVIRFQPEVVIFDNVMSLMCGDQGTEIPWSETQPLISWLTSQGIAQLWLDHTGHNQTRQYGSSTKMWRQDAIGQMTARDGKAAPGEVSFKLSFNAPAGKARERDAENWRDFADRTITMTDDGWASSNAETAGAVVDKPLTETEQKWWAALMDAVKEASDPAGRVGRDAWFRHACRHGLAKPILSDDKTRQRTDKQAMLRKQRGLLMAKGWLAYNDDDTVTLLHGVACAEFSSLE
jgi:hypothetical protein